MAVVKKIVVLLGLRSLEQEIMFVAVWKEQQRTGEREREKILSEERFPELRETDRQTDRQTDRDIPWVQREKDERDSLGPGKKRFPGLRERERERFPGLRERERDPNVSLEIRHKRETRCPPVCWQSYPEVDVTVVSR